MNGEFIYTPEDERDYPICMAYDDDELVKIPDKFKTSFQPPYEKQVAGNCVAQTIANIMEVMWYKTFGVHEDFSVGFTYGNRYAGQHKGSGMTGYMACGNLCKDGDVKASIFENPSEVPTIIERVKVFKEQFPNWKELSYIPKSYIRTNSTNEVKKFILKHDIPVMAVVEVNDFWIGGGLHAMALYGWDGDTAIMQNSWGENHKMKIVELPFKDIKEYWMILPYSVMNFSDITEAHWAYKYVAKCVEKEYMLGYPDGTFKPDKDMTRAEAAALIYRVLKGEEKI
jgi:hypothetical protein